MTTTMKKRMFALAAMMVLLVAMAIPAFAAGFSPDGQNEYLLNINGATGSDYRGRVLNLIKVDPNDPDAIGVDQNFVISTRQGFSGYYMMVARNTAYAVNRDSDTARAIIWPLSSGAADSRLYDNSTNTIRLYRTRELLTARLPIAEWSQVYFGGAGIQVWTRR